MLSLRFVIPALLLPLVAACGGGDAASVPIDREKAWETLDVGMSEEEFDAKLPALAEVEIDPPPVVGKDYDPVFPDPIPFDPSEWETNTPPDSVAVKDALKGGRLKSAILSWPATIRTEGPNSRSSFLFTIHSFVYEVLLSFDTTRMEFYPGLATHWQIGEDKMTFRFRIDPRARFSDGREVTADDVVATIEHMKNPDRKDPGIASRWNDQVEYAKMLDKYTVEIKGRAPRWRNFLTIANGLLIYPAAYIRMDGATYIKDWNWKLPPGSGPYGLNPEDIKKDQSITLRRRKDWWGEVLPDNQGLYNFDQIEWIVVRDRELMYQKFLAGELDTYFVSRAQRWVEELEDVEAIKKGWIQMRRIFNLDPQGFGGFCINMRKPPYDNRDVRLALAHLFNREKLMSSFFFYQYEYMDSYFPGMPFARPDAERIRYDPDRARELLAKAGWKGKDADGWLVNENGERFPEIKFEYSLPGWDRIYDVFKHDLWNEAGIKMSLKLVNRGTLSKKMWEYKFDLFWITWTASNFPTLELTFHSKNADRAQTNNLSGFKDPRMDEIIDEYKFEFDGKKRTKLLQEADRILFDAHPYILAWYGPNFRILYWDKFGHPPEYAGRFTPDERNVMAYWWYDPERDRKTRENRRKGVSNYPDSPNGQCDEIDQKYWLYNKFPMKDE